MPNLLSKFNKRTFFLLLLITIIRLQTFSQTSALSFDGTNDYVSTSLNITNSYTAFTVESWINYTSTTNNTNIIGQNGTLEVAFINSRLYIWINTNNGWINTNYLIDASFPSSVWNHFAITGDGSTLKIYINGVLKVSTSTSWANLSNSANTFNIGGNTQSPVVYFAGKMDEVRIWNVARTQAQIKSSMFNANASTTGLVSYFKFNDGSGTTLTNSVSGGPNGTLTNFALSGSSSNWVSSPVQGAANALGFDGVNDYVNIPDNNSLDLTSNYTLEAWIKPNTLGDWEGIVSKYHNNTGPYSYTFRVMANGSLDFNGRFTSSGEITINNWYHVAAVDNNGTLSIFINGVSKSLSGTTATYTVAANSDPVTIGKDFDPSPRYFDGSIDEVRIWNVARSASEISSNYNKEIPITTSGLVAYYTFNQGIANGANTELTTVIDQSGSNNGTLANFVLTSSASNYVSQNGSLTVLPLQWHSFTAKKQNSSVLLEWSTAQEQNSKDFIVQHSTNGTNWNNIGTIAAAGNSTVTMYYNLVHTTPADGNNYYRILQRDLDNKQGYSGVRTVKFNSDNSLFSIIGNPVVNGQLQIQVNAASTLTLYSSDGKLLWTKQFAAGTQTVNMSGYAKGIYLLKSEGQAEKLALQ